MLLFRACLLVILTVVASTVITPEALAQTDSERKKIGLVLSGGGARGAAHVGVIKLLEELEIPVDYIVGTSLGSVVGALYSLGKSPIELESTLATLDWNRGFIDDLPRTSLPMRRKDEEDQFLINFELGVSGRSLTLPVGVIQGHSLHLLLKNLIGGAALERDFNRFPIPFRAVTTDIETAETVVLDSGDLAKALQASMAIPAIFAPVEIGGRLLVDGGVSNNLAIDVVREMGADIVIAVDISTPLSERNQLNSIIRIVDQLTNLLTRGNVEQQIQTLKGADIYIQPDLGSFTSADFGFVTDISRLGEKAARAQATELASLSVSSAAYTRYKQELNRNRPGGLPNRIGDISFTNNSSLDTKRLMQRSSLKENTTFLTTELHDAIDLIYSTDVFEHVDYELQPSPDTPATADLFINAKRKSWGTDTIKFGFQLEDNFEGDNNFNLSAGYTRRTLNRFGGDLRVIGQLGELPRVLVEYFQPFDTRSNFFTLMQLDHQQFSRGTFSENVQTESFRLRRNQLGVFAGWQDRDRIDFRLGVVTGSGLIRRIIGDDTVSVNDAFREGSLQISARYDSLNSITFPSGGQRLSFFYEQAFDALNADTEFEALSLNAAIARKSGRNRWLLSGQLSSSLKGTVPPQSRFERGSILSTAGLRGNTEVGERAGRLGLLGYRPLTAERVEALEYPFFIGASIEASQVVQEDEQFSVDEFQFGGSLFAAADTPVGPLFLGLGWVQGEAVSALLSLGLTF